jgi:hypothetical protein
MNPITNTIIREYEDDKNYSKFRFNHSADSIALIIIDIVLYGVVFVWLNELVKGVVVVPM